MQKNRASMPSASISTLAALLLSACATAPYAPAALESIPFQDRAQTQMEGPVTVRAAVPRSGRNAGAVRLASLRQWNSACLVGDPQRH